MASDALRGRANWQTESGALALSTEKLLIAALQTTLDRDFPATFAVDPHPTEFRDIYSTHVLPDSTLAAIHNIDMAATSRTGAPKYRWGISLDFAVRNMQNGKILFGEVKRQDGWVESTLPAAGRGNAHERSCKYFTPGLMKVMRARGGLSDGILPFWLVFVGDITRDPRRNREIAFWFDGYDGNYFMWRNTNDPETLVEFFKEMLLPYLL